MSVFLVTGGAGFIGSALVRHIIKNTNDIVVNVDCLTYAGNTEVYFSAKIFICSDRGCAPSVSSLFKYV